MGKIDTITKEYMDNNERFADVFNNYLYDGKQVINKDDLKQLDTTELINIFDDENNKAYLNLQKYRDLLKFLSIKKDDNNIYLVLGIENQSYIDYALPIRIMLYDSFNYDSQVKEITTINNGKIKSSSDEYLSGIKKDDKLIPIITLVIYYGTDLWDGPTCLHDMLLIEDKEILKYIPNYKLNLLQLSFMEDEDINKFKSDLKCVAYYIKNSNDKNKLQDVLNNNSEFNSVERITAGLIKELTNTNIKLPEGKETINMCLAIEQIKLDSKLQTLYELVKQGLLTVSQASNNANLSEEEFIKKMNEAKL